MSEQKDIEASDERERFIAYQERRIAALERELGSEVRRLEDENESLRQRLRMRHWTLYPSDYGGDAIAADDEERLIAVGPDVRGGAIEVVPAAAYRGAVASRDALAAALDHALRDPAIAAHAGWQDDARKALVTTRGRGPFVERAFDEEGRRG